MTARSPVNARFQLGFSCACPDTPIAWLSGRICRSGNWPLHDLLDVLGHGGEGSVQKVPMARSSETSKSKHDEIWTAGTISQSIQDANLGPANDEM